MPKIFNTSTNRRHIARCSALELGPEKHDFLEGFPELGVEDGVDDGVDEAVHVAQPGGEEEGGHARLAGQVQLAAHGVQDVAREEGHPAYQEDAWNKGPGERRGDLSHILLLHREN